jgi:hypothetical protein
MGLSTHPLSWAHFRRRSLAISCVEFRSHSERLAHVKLDCNEKACWSSSTYFFFARANSLFGSRCKAAALKCCSSRLELRHCSGEQCLIQACIPLLQLLCDFGAIFPRREVNWRQRSDRRMLSLGRTRWETKRIAGISQSQIKCELNLFCFYPKVCCVDSMSNRKSDRRRG